jgi:hypothetical protein
MSRAREVLFEIVQSGAIAKVTAIDAQTGIEATIQGPASAGAAMLKKSAVQKLIYLLNKKNKK